MSNPETDLQRAIIRELRSIGFWVVRLQVSGRRSTRSVVTGEPGLPDLLLPGLGHLEVKLPKKPLSVHQELWHSKAKRSGVNVGVARTVSEALDIALAWRRAKAA